MFTITESALLRNFTKDDTTALEKLWYWSVNYRSGNDEAREEIENGVERAGHDGSHLGVGCDGHGHHPVVREVEEGAEGEVPVPEELGGLPEEADHRVADEAVIGALKQHKRELDEHLQARHGTEPTLSGHQTAPQSRIRRPAGSTSPVARRTRSVGTWARAYASGE